MFLQEKRAKKQKFKARETNEFNTIQYAEWDISKRMVDENVIAEADYIVHLAGAGVGDKRWTKKRRREIINSREYSGKLIVDTLKKIPNHVKAVISASAIGWYSPTPILQDKNNKADGFRTEDDLADKSFLGRTCQEWEEAIDPVNQLGKRLVKLRTGIVLSNEGGVLPEFKKPLHFRFAPILGSGKQIISWIHIDDLVRIYIEAIKNEKLSGVYNAVAPHPVSNKEFIFSLAKTMKGNLFIPVHVPAFLLKLALGEMSIEVLKSTGVSCDKIRQAGFTFQYSEIDKALQQLSGR